jgi:hypothetical protein
MQHIALTLAGVIGAATAIFHGVLTQRLMVRPIGRRLVATGVSPTIQRIVPPLLHFSTYNWLIGGIVLIAAANTASAETRLWISLLVGSAFLYAALANAWATRGRHPGWLLMAAAVVLIAVDMFG